MALCSSPSSAWAVAEARPRGDTIGLARWRPAVVVDSGRVPIVEWQRSSPPHTHHTTDRGAHHVPSDLTTTVQPTPPPLLALRTGGSAERYASDAAPRVSPRRRITTTSSARRRTDARAIEQQTVAVSTLSSTGPVMHLGTAGGPCTDTSRYIAVRCPPSGGVPRTSKAPGLVHFNIKQKHCQLIIACGLTATGLKGMPTPGCLARAPLPTQNRSNQPGDIHRLFTSVPGLVLCPTSPSSVGHRSLVLRDPRDPPAERRGVSGGEGEHGGGGEESACAGQPLMVLFMHLNALVLLTDVRGAAHCRYMPDRQLTCLTDG